MERTTGSRSFARSDRRVGPALKGALLAGALALVATLGLPAGAQTQQAAQAPTQGITVIGYGKSSASAETAEIQMVVSQEEFGPPRAPDPDATPGAQEREAVGPMVEGLQAAGVPEEDISVVVGAVIGGFYGPGGPGVARVDVAVDMPTQERITELIDAATVGAAEENLVLVLIGVGYGVSDCAPLEREAREMAFNDAGTRAELQAELMGVQLGEAVAASDVPVNFSESLNAYYGALTPTQLPCSPPAPVPTSGSPVSVPPFDPTDEAEVNVYAQVAVSFAIDTEAAATPAS
ncbi:MAG: SIMPL domain-containing protein [Chloroflexia bacterium]|nr:SIMPL domain-containing protein [Chloroflexia bacterium]